MVLHKTPRFCVCTGCNVGESVTFSLNIAGIFRMFWKVGCLIEINVKSCLKITFTPCKVVRQQFTGELSNFVTWRCHVPSESCLPKTIFHGFIQKIKTEPKRDLFLGHTVYTHVFPVTCVDLQTRDYRCPLALHNIFHTSLSLHLIGHFPGEPELAGVYWSKGWWRWWWRLEL